MGLFGFSKKKSKTPSKAEIEEFSRKAKILNDYYIMCDSIEIMQETVYPQTFFKRYKMAIEKAEIVKNANDELSKDAAKTLLEVKRNSVKIFNAFFDRCNKEGKLIFAKNEIISHKSEIPEESYKLFQKLINLSVDENDASEYVFCSITFNENGKSYYYLSGGKDVQCGDTVVVPIGRYNEKKEGKIVKIETFKGKDAPLPPSSLKHIISVQ